MIDEAPPADPHAVPPAPPGAKETVRVHLLNGNYIDIATQWNWREFVRTLLIDRYVATTEGLIPWHAIGMVMRTSVLSGVAQEHMPLSERPMQGSA